MYGAPFDKLIRAVAESGQAMAARGREEEWLRERMANHLNPEGAQERQIHDGRWFLNRERCTREGGIVSTWSEVTTLKQAEQALKSYAHKLEVSNQELSEFAFVASHDLQELTRKIQAFGDLLMEEYGDALAGDGAAYLGYMQNAAGRMRALINDLLSLTRVSTHGGKFSPVDLNETLRDVMADMERLIEESQARVEYGQLPTVEADPTQMYQLLQNLISNALKYHGDAPPCVKIAGEIVAENGESQSRPDAAAEMVRLTEEDNGIGFDEKQADQIFGIFKRLHGQGEFEGTGIGLAVCKKIVDNHEGSITATGRTGDGTKFTVSLPTRRN